MGALRTTGPARGADAGADVGWGEHAELRAEPGAAAEFGALPRHQPFVGFSRNFVARTQAQVETFPARPLEGESYPILMIDGKGLGKHTLVVLLGITATGRKDVLGMAEGSTENGALWRRLLSDLVDRGLAVEEPRLMVIDGGKDTVSDQLSLMAHVSRWLTSNNLDVEEQSSEQIDAGSERCSIIRHQVERVRDGTASK